MFRHKNPFYSPQSHANHPGTTRIIRLEGRTRWSVECHIYMEMDSELCSTIYSYCILRLLLFLQNNQTVDNSRWTEQKVNCVALGKVLFVLGFHKYTYRWEYILCPSNSGEPLQNQWLWSQIWIWSDNRWIDCPPCLSCPLRWPIPNIIRDRSIKNDRSIKIYRSETITETGFERVSGTESKRDTRMTKRFEEASINWIWRRQSSMMV